MLFFAIFNFVFMQSAANRLEIRYKKRLPVSKDSLDAKLTAG